MKNFISKGLSAFSLVLGFCVTPAVAEPFGADLVPAELTLVFEEPPAFEQKRMRIWLKVQNVGNAPTVPGRLHEMTIKVGGTELVALLYGNSPSGRLDPYHSIEPGQSGMLLTAINSTPENPNYPFEPCTEVPVEIDIKKDVQFASEGMDPYANDAKTLLAHNPYGAITCF